MSIILHIIPRDVWAEARQTPAYRGDTLDAEGFIHFSTASQVVQVANARFRGHPGLQILRVDTDRLTERLVFERPFEAPPGSWFETQEFPHLYGPLNTDAVIDALDFEPGADGTFSLPPELQV